MKNQEERITEQKQSKAKKKSKIDRVYQMHLNGKSVKEIAERMKISERVVRSYIWRKKNPQKYQELLRRYFTKKRQKEEVEEMKAKVEEQKQNSK